MKLSNKNKIGKLESLLTDSNKSTYSSKAKHALSVIGLSTGAGIGEIDALDRLNDIGALSTPISVSYNPGGPYIFEKLANNQIYQYFSHLLMSAGISGGPNNTLGILVAGGALIVGGVAARSYIKAGLRNDTERIKMQKNGYKSALASVGMLGLGLYIGSQSFLPVVNDVLYKAPLSSIGYAAIGALAITAGIYQGLNYLRYKYLQKRKAK